MLQSVLKITIDVMKICVYNFEQLKVVLRLVWDSVIKILLHIMNSCIIVLTNQLKIRIASLIGKYILENLVTFRLNN